MIRGLQVMNKTIRKGGAISCLDNTFVEKSFVFILFNVRFMYSHLSANK